MQLIYQTSSALMEKAVRIPLVIRRKKTASIVCAGRFFLFKSDSYCAFFTALNHAFNSVSLEVAAAINVALIIEPRESSGILVLYSV